MTEERHGLGPALAESPEDRSESRDRQFQRLSVVILGLCAAAMLIDLLPPLAALSGLYNPPYFVAAWILIPGLPLNGATVVLFPIGIYLARRAESGAVLKGVRLELVSATVFLFTMKMLAYWVMNLSSGRHLNVTFFISTFAIGSAALWAWRRAKASGTPYRPVYYLLALLFGILLTEFAVYGTRNS